MTLGVSGRIRANLNLIGDLLKTTPSNVASRRWFDGDNECHSDFVIQLKSRSALERRHT